MGSVDDWAAKAAHRILYELDHEYEYDSNAHKHAERVAAIIATHAEPLAALLRESRREHLHDEECGDCCPCCTCESWDGVAAAQDGGELDAEPEPNSDEPCTCGADAWNARLDAVLAGREVGPGGPIATGHKD